MTRTEAISFIHGKLASFDDDKLVTVADILQSMNAPHQPVRQLSPREVALLEQSKDDFSAGRSYSHEEMTTMRDERLARRGVPRSTA